MSLLEKSRRLVLLHYVSSNIFIKITFLTMHYCFSHSACVVAQEACNTHYESSCILINDQINTYYLVDLQSKYVGFTSSFTSLILVSGKTIFICSI